jgi:hypothetical protein
MRHKKGQVESYFMCKYIEVEEDSSVTSVVALELTDNRLNRRERDTTEQSNSLYGFLSKG